MSGGKKMRHDKKELKKWIISILCILLLLVQMIFPGQTVNAEDTVTHNLLFTSDIHSVNNYLKTWLKYTKKSGIDNIDYMCFGGDYASTYDSDEISEVKSILLDAYPDTDGIYTLGNHEHKGSLDSEEFETITGCLTTGYSVINEDYIIYTFGATTSKQSFEKKDINTLGEFLSSLTEEQQKLPIFIISHYPLHKYGSRTTKNADLVVELLNQYSNVIFLYGHNHTKGDTNYGTIQTAGDILEVSKKTSEEINFTYTSLGAMKDGAKHGIMGMVAQIEETDTSRNVTLSFRNLRQFVGETLTLNYAK